MILLFENFCRRIADVRKSALAAGFSTWLPGTKGEVGSSRYEGMGFVGEHSLMIHALADVLGKPVYPNLMFFRVSNEKAEPAYVHSDRETGDYTCVAYLSEHKEVSGTGFFQHRETGLRQMPSFQEMAAFPQAFEKLKREMVEGDEAVWDQVDFVRGCLNRAVIFDAPLFHARCPKQGIGTTAEDGRLVWVCHFKTRML